MTGHPHHLIRVAPGQTLLDLAAWQAMGGGRALQKGMAMGPDAIFEEVRRGMLRGRGGAGFPAGVKWGFLLRDTQKPRYLVVNADEGEPGTFKDRYFLEQDPFSLLEGLCLAAFAIGAKTAWIYVRGEFSLGIKTLVSAVKAFENAGFLSEIGLEIRVHPGAGAYVCGEESALLESIEGKPGRPRNRPPFPAVSGLFGCPTIINNVETMACVRLLIDVGAEAFVSMGVPGDGGPKLFGISGQVARPGLYEAPMGTPLGRLIEEYAGGVSRPILGIIPGGSSTAVLGPEHLDVPMDFDSLKAAGSMLGTGAVTVFTDDVCPVAVLLRIVRFYAHESCGQCTPCREGTGWLLRLVESIESGQARAHDRQLLMEVARQIMGRTICALGDAAAIPVISFCTRFAEIFEAHISLGRCPYGESS